MHERAFAKSLVPRRRRVLGLPLLPFTIGHELWLTARGNPLVTDSWKFTPAEGRAALSEAVLVCANRWSELGAWNSGLLNRLGLAVWLARMRRVELEPELLKFRDYLDEAYEPVPTMSLHTAELSPHEAGAPAPLRLLQFLTRDCRLGEIDALDYPLAAARWRFCAWQESNGVFRIKNRHDYEFDEFVERMEAEASAAAAEALSKVQGPKSKVETEAACPA
jgi:hypothetical protein